MRNYGNWSLGRQPLRARLSPQLGYHTGFFLLTEASPSARGRHVRRNDHLYHLRNQSVRNGLRNGPRPDIVPVFSCDLLGIVGYLVWVSPVTRGADIHGNHA